MKEIVGLILAILLGVIFVFLAFGAPAPLLKREKESLVGTYLMKWDQFCIPNPCVFHRNGTYDCIYVNSYAEDLSVRFTGQWHWNKETRILTMIDKSMDGDVRHNEYRFKLAPNKLETETGNFWLRKR